MDFLCLHPCKCKSFIAALGGPGGCMLLGWLLCSKSNGKSLLLLQHSHAQKHVNHQNPTTAVKATGGSFQYIGVFAAFLLVFLGAFCLFAACVFLLGFCYFSLLFRMVSYAPSEIPRNSYEFLGILTNS